MVFVCMRARPPAPMPMMTSSHASFDRLHQVGTWKSCMHRCMRAYAAQHIQHHRGPASPDLRSFHPCQREVGCRRKNFAHPGPRRTPVHLLSFGCATRNPMYSGSFVGDRLGRCTTGDEDGAPFNSTTESHYLLRSSSSGASSSP